MDTTIYTRETFHIVKAKLDDLYALADKSPESMNEDSRVIRDIAELNLSMPAELSMNYKMQRDSRTANADVSTKWNILRIDALVGISTCKTAIVRQRLGSIDAVPPPRGVEHALSPGNTFR